MSEATDMLALYITAEKAVLKNQSYTINGVAMTKANLTEIKSGRREWQIKVNAENASTRGGSSRYSLVDFRN